MPFHPADRLFRLLNMLQDFLHAIHKKPGLSPKRQTVPICHPHLPPKGRVIDGEEIQTIVLSPYRKNCFRNKRDAYPNFDHIHCRHDIRCLQKDIGMNSQLIQIVLGYIPNILPLLEKDKLLLFKLKEFFMRQNRLGRL